MQTHATSTQRLLVITSAPGNLDETGLKLDIKFVEGMTFYCANWAGPVDVIAPHSNVPLPFGRHYRMEGLPFGLTLIDDPSRISAEVLARYDVVLCSGDDHSFLELSDLCISLPVRFYYIIEYILETRLQIVLLERKTSRFKKLRSAIWTLLQEGRRRRAFRKADGLQANGYPAAAVYSKLNTNTVLYLDNRMRREMYATANDMDAQRAYLRSGAPLRLLYSGRLEALKGVQDLVPVAAHLRRAQVHFTLDIFGSGSLEREIRDAIHREGLTEHVFLKGAVDFESELVPYARSSADVFLCCHKQSDPSCTYLESMGCGLAIAGYDNRMWRALHASSGGGWTARLGDTAQLANVLAKASADRIDTANRCAKSLEFASAHNFEVEFGRRLAQLSGSIADVRDGLTKAEPIAEPQVSTAYSVGTSLSRDLGHLPDLKRQS